MSFTFGNSYSGFLRINKRRRSKLARIAKLTTYKKKRKRKQKERFWEVWARCTHTKLQHTALKI